MAAPPPDEVGAPVQPGPELVECPSKLDLELPNTPAPEPPVPLRKGTRVVLDVLSFVVNAEPVPTGKGVADRFESPAQPSVEDKVLSARFLISLFALDAFSWGTGKIFQYEVVLMVERLGWCYVTAALVLTTAEVVIEVLASACTPYICAWVQRTRQVNSKHLVLFALKVYWLSNVLALLLYPWFGLAIHGFGIMSPAVVTLLGFTRTIQYAFGNQLGDASVEMAKPHWLATFRGTRLAFPGCRCCPRLLRQSSVSVLATYLTLMRFAVFLLIAIIYVGISRSDISRWVFAGILLIWNVAAPSLLLCQRERITAGIVESSALDEETPQKLLGVSSLSASEWSYLGFVVMIKGVPPQSAEALQSVLVVELSSAAQLAMLAAGALAIGGMLLWRIRRAPAPAAVREVRVEPAAAGETKSVTSSQVTSSQATTGQRNPRSLGIFGRRWLIPTVGITLLLGVGTVCISNGSLLATFIAVIIWLPMGPLQRSLDVEIDKFLLRYDAQRSSSLVFWEQLGQVLVNGPLLAGNWWAITATGCEDKHGAEIKAASVVLFTALSAMGLLVAYCALVDGPLLGKKSLAAMVNAASRHALSGPPGA